MVKNTRWIMKHPFAEIKENYCRIYDEECHWGEDCHCFNQKFCIYRQEKIPVEKLQKFKQTT